MNVFDLILKRAIRVGYEITYITFITQNPCPSSITSCITLTSHVVTVNFLSTMSTTRLSTVFTVPPFFTCCYTEKKVQCYVQNVASTKLFTMNCIVKDKKRKIWIVKTMFVNLLVLQYIPVHPLLHLKHVPCSMWHVLSLQFAGQRFSQFLP